MKLRNLITIFTFAGLLAITAACGGKPKTPGLTKEAGSVATVQELDTAGIQIKDGIIIPKEMPVVVDFNATWCGPCKQYSPIFHEVADSSLYAGNVIFLSIDVDEHPEIANKYEVMNIPCTVFILPGGGVMGKEVGVLTAERLESYVNQLMAQSAGEGNAI